MFLTNQFKIARLPSISHLLNQQPVRLSTFLFSPRLTKKFKALGVVGWGVRQTTEHARQFALKNNLPFVALEDGFLRSFRSGQSVPPLSIVVDESGVYYDCKIKECIC